MVASVQSPEDVVNIALVRLGWPEAIGNLYDGSKASDAALRIYAQTRDALLREFEWGFAERNATLTLLKSAPGPGYIPPATWSSEYPPLPWFYEYAYPTDCLKVRSLRATPTFVPAFDPKPVVFRLYDDTSLNPPAKVILTNLANAIAVYTGQATDITIWDADFVEAMADGLARRLAKALPPLLKPGALETKKMEGAEEAAETVAAASIIG